MEQQQRRLVAEDVAKLRAMFAPDGGDPRTVRVTALDGDLECANLAHEIAEVLVGMGTSVECDFATGPGMAADGGVQMTLLNTRRPWIKVSPPRRGVL